MVTMAAANIPHIYQPLFDHDGLFKETFRFLLGVAHGIDFYIEQGKRKGAVTTTHKAASFVNLPMLLHIGMEI